MSTEIKHIDKEKTDLGVHVDLCVQRYNGILKSLKTLQYAVIAIIVLLLTDPARRAEMATIAGKFLSKFTGIDLN